MFDRRIEQAVDTTSSFNMADAAIERYVYDGDNVVLDFLDPDGDGTGTAQALKTRSLFGPNVDQILAQEDAGTNAVLWHLGDHLGTVRDVIESDGDLVAHIAYDSFGRVTSIKDSGGTPTTSPTRYLFTGREFDSATGLQYNRARWYDANAGQWASEDPIGFRARDTNLHRYVANAPVEARDPFGLDGEASPPGQGPNRRFGMSSTVASFQKQQGSVHIIRRTSPPPNRTPNEAFVEGLILGVRIHGRSVANAIGLGDIVDSEEDLRRDAAGLFGKDDGDVVAAATAAANSGVAATGGAIAGKLTEILSGMMGGFGGGGGAEDDGLEQPDAADSPLGDVQDHPQSKGEITKLKEAGIDVHELKGGKGASQFDLFKDKAGNIFVKPKSGAGPGDPTGINIYDF